MKESERIMKKFHIISFSSAALAAAMLMASGPAAAIDEEAAMHLARANNCFKCHSVMKTKEGPAWSEVAKKYHDKSNGQKRLVEHLTTGEKAKFPDGHQEDHKIIKTNPPNDAAQIKNLADWILAL